MEQFYPPVPRWQLVVAMLICLALCLLALTGCATANQTRSLAIGFCAADIATTTVGIHMGGSEQNPLLKSGGIPIAIGLNFALIYYVDKETKDMPEWARKNVWTWAAIIRAVPVLWNLNQIRKR